MGGTGRLPAFVVFEYARWRAQRIEDPLERLRFLQKTVPPAVESLAHRRPPNPLRIVTLAALVLLPTSTVITNNAMIPVHPEVLTAMEEKAGAVPRIWAVDINKEFEVYSNGLRVERRFEVGHEARSYRPLDPAHDYEFSGEARTEPAGIVFHTTESLIAPFEAERNRELKRAGEELLGYIRRHCAYHFVIDRFGRVFRLVKETDSANHAGNSVWADRRWTYINLNQSFLGVAFEAQSHGDDGAPSVSPAQIHSGRILTDMLRSKYHIPATNCVAHAQVSVNPSNMVIAYHTDWANDLPFAALGLSDNYSLPLASLSSFGFHYDASLVRLSGNRPWRGLQAAEQMVKEQASARGLSVEAYRSVLQRRYRERLAATKSLAAAEEMN
jgi:hypothetical protein